MNYQIIAATETKMWQAYYQGNREAIYANLKIYLEEIYQIKNSHFSKSLTESFATAYGKFGVMSQTATQEEYDTEVLPLLITSYEKLHNILNASWDPKQAAIADLSWMIARRQDSSLNPEIVASKMRELYYILYGKHDNNHFIRAAYLRAVVGRYRDQCQDAWGQTNDKDWQTINTLLDKSYQELSLGIAANQR